MSELQDDIMRDIELVLRDYIGEGRAVMAADMINKRIWATCERAELNISTAEEKADELEGQLDDAEYECREAEKELEKGLKDVEWEHMREQFNYYAERTKVTT